MEDDRRQRQADTLYWKLGPCCAGCDHWEHIEGLTGTCRKSAPVPHQERYALLGISRVTLPPKAGHPFTRGSHKCGDFKDEFDWLSLDPWYLRSIGYPKPPRPEVKS